MDQMTHNPTGKVYRVEEHHWVHGLMGVPIGEYQVYVGDWGWDDGDLYILDPKGKKWKLREISE